jgi:hypothetical protein
MAGREEDFAQLARNGSLWMDVVRAGGADSAAD